MLNISFTTMLYVFLPAIGAGLIQTTTGFGSGIFLMLFFPLFLPILKSSALSSLITLCLSVMLAWRFRRDIDYRLSVLPAVFYLIASGIAINVAARIDCNGLKAYFGLFLMAVAIYFIFFAKKLTIKKSVASAAVCSGISGVAGGLFGIGGPPMVLYFLAASKDDKMKYLATIQFFFVITGIYNAGMRAVSGILTVDILPLVIPGMIGLWIGKTYGAMIINRINVEQLKKMIYIFLAAAGLLTFVSNL